MYSPRLYKYRDSYVLYIPTVHAFGSLLLTHTLLVQTHTHDVSTPWFKLLNSCVSCALDFEFSRFPIPEFSDSHCTPRLYKLRGECMHTVLLISIHTNILLDSAS